MANAPEETIAVRIARLLAERIVAGGIGAGAKLRQDEIAREFSTSHVPVREAFRRLEAQGLVVSEPRRGVRVAGFDIEAVREVAVMRAALEGLALRHAAPRITSAVLAEAEAATVEADRSTDVRTWEDANRRFHRLLLAPCAMPRLLAVIDDLHAMSARFLFSAWRSGWETRTDLDHRAILDHLRQGRVDDAVSLLERHVQRIGADPTRSIAARDAFAIVG